MERHVFAPLQMSHSHAGAAGARNDGAAEGFYRWFGSRWLPADVPVADTGMPSAIMYSSAEDLSHVLMAHLSGGQYAGTPLVSPASAAALLTPTASMDGFSSYAMGWVARPMWETLDPAAPQEQAYELPLILEHTGSWPTTQTYLALVPSEGLGIALLVNGADPATPSLALAMDSNIVRILHGMEPAPAFIQEDPLQHYGWLASLLFRLAGLASLTMTGRVLYGWARGAVPGIMRRIAVVVVPLLLDGFILWLGLAYVPARFDADVPVVLRMVPDVGIFMLPALVVAGVWGAARTVLAAVLWCRDLSGAGQHRRRGLGSSAYPRGTQAALSGSSHPSSR